MFTLGQKVKFANKQGQILTATIIRISEKSCTVVTDGNGVQWRVSSNLLAPADASQIPTKNITNPQFKKGDRVEFKGVNGTVIRVNDKTYTVALDDGRQGRISSFSLKPSKVSVKKKVDDELQRYLKDILKIGDKEAEYDENAFEAAFS